MSISNFLNKYFDIQPSEEKNFRLLFFQSLFTGFSISFFVVVCNSNFIKLFNIPKNPFPAFFLPLAYIISGLLGYVLIVIYKWYQTKKDIGVIYLLSLIAFAILAIILYAIYSYANIMYMHNGLIADKGIIVFKIISFIGFIFVMPIATVLALGFSTLCVRMFNISQSKRMVALIGTGEVIASIIAYLLVAMISTFIHPFHLLIFSAIATLASVIPMKRIYSLNKSLFNVIPSKIISKKFDLSFFTDNKYYLLIATATVFSIVALYFADYTYLISVGMFAKGSSEFQKTSKGVPLYELATVVGVIFSIIKFGELIFSVLSGKIIRSLGMRYSLILLPGLLIFFTISALSSSIFDNNASIPYFLLFFLLINKWCERAVRRGVFAPSMKILFQVAPRDERMRLQTSIDGTVAQVASILAGLILMIIALVFKNCSDINYIKILAFVCLLAFVVWCYTNNSLYNLYRISIINYLNIINPFLGKKTQTENILNLKGINFIHDLSNNNMQQTVDQLVYEQSFNKEYLLELISAYNFNSKSSILHEDITFNKLTKIYYQNDNFFSRLLIIWYLNYLPSENAANILNEFYNISVIDLRLQMLIILIKSGTKLKSEDRNYVTSLSQEIVSEVMWTESAIKDIGDNNIMLTGQLDKHILKLKEILFQLLKLLYDPSSIQIIQDIINDKEQSIENQLFAIELMDVTLDAEHKSWILPVFEDIPYSAKVSRLNNLVFIYSLSAENRLKDIVMKDVKLIDPVIKQIAFEEYYKITKDKNILNAFATSGIDNLNATANMLKNANNVHPFYNKIKIINNFNLDNVLEPTLLYYFLIWGIIPKNIKQKKVFSPSIYKSKHINEVATEDFIYSVDTLGLALTLKLQYNKI